MSAKISNTDYFSIVIVSYLNNAYFRIAYANFSVPK